MAAGSSNSLLEAEDLFCTSYIPNNPSLVLDTSLWKTGEQEQNQSSPLVQLQPILINQSSTTGEGAGSQDPTFFLSPEEGSCFTLSSVHQDLAEFLLPCPTSDLPPGSEFEANFNLQTSTASSENPTEITNREAAEGEESNQQDLQELSISTIDQLDSFLVNSTLRPENTKEMHPSLPSMLRNSDYPHHNNIQQWYLQSADNRNASLKKIKASPSSSPRVYDHDFHHPQQQNQLEYDHGHAFLEPQESGNSANGGLVGGNGGAAFTSTWHDSNQSGFLSPTAVSAAAAAMGLSPTHLAYGLNHDYHQANGWPNSPQALENPTDLSQASHLPIPSPIGCNEDSSSHNFQNGGFGYQQNYGHYYNNNGGGNGGESAGYVTHGSSSADYLKNSSSSGMIFDSSRISFNFRTDQVKSPSRSSSDQDMDLHGSPRMSADDMGFIHMMHQTSPDSSTDTTKNVCNVCGKTYARPSTLKTHMRTHSGERPYRCYECNKSFSQAANLTAHCRTHSGEKPFHCNICNRRFSQSSSVTTHMRTHNGERPYKCRQCRKAFSDSSTLTKHLRIHSGEKPYQCKLCQLRFSQSGNLNRHMRIHEQHHQNQIC